MLCLLFNIPNYENLMTRTSSETSLCHLVLQTSDFRQKNPEKDFWGPEAGLLLSGTKTKQNTNRQSGIDNSLTCCSQWYFCLNSIFTNFKLLEDKDHISLAFVSLA